MQGGNGMNSQGLQQNTKEVDSIPRVPGMLSDFAKDCMVVCVV